MTSASQFLDRVRGRLIVSCQALPDEPLYGSALMARMALAAQIGGAAGIRANTPQDVRAICAAVDLPVIGLYKEGSDGVYITPTYDHVRQIAQAGADVVALDATSRPRPDGSDLADIIARSHGDGVTLLGDVATLDEALAAQAVGIDFVAPTLVGYTETSLPRDTFDFELLEQMVARLTVPVIAEGHIRTPEEAQRALQLGAVAVVVGSAITRPRTITASFVQAIGKVTAQVQVAAKFDETPD